jgi:hypothetical protein
LLRAQPVKTRKNQYTGNREKVLSETVLGTKKQSQLLLLLLMLVVVAVKGGRGVNEWK